MDVSAAPARAPIENHAERLRVTVLGSTGSVGKNALDIISRDPARFDVVALVANRNVDELARQARAVGADCAVVADDTCGPDLNEALSGTDILNGAGRTAVLEAIDRPADIVVGAIVGAAGLEPTLAAMKAGRTLALANKECLVCAGGLFMGTATDLGVTVLPVDSEHNAIFQVFEAGNASEIEKIILTSSGGPFRTFSRDEMAGVSPDQALKHPNFSMGSRITIDSATMMNKGFEVIEAFHLFPVSKDQVDILVHPQQVVHGLVQYKDGSLLAQMGAPDMRTPLAHCFAWPGRMDTPVERLDLSQITALTFEKPDFDRFPTLRLAYSALAGPVGATAALNAADEIAVAAFLQRRIRFLDIPAAIEATIDALDRRGELGGAQTLDGTLAVDSIARKICTDWIAARPAP